MDYLAGMLIDRLPRIMEDIARLDSKEDIYLYSAPGHKFVVDLRQENALEYIG